MNYLVGFAGFLGCASLLLAGCNDGTVLEVEATSMAGARIVFGGESTTLDSSGEGSLSIPAVYDGRVTLAFERAGARVTLTAECVPGSFETPDPLDRIRLLARRRIADSECALIALEVDQDGETRLGEYTPDAFDDAPCGPFALP